MIKSSLLRSVRPLLRSAASVGLFGLLLSGYFSAAQTAVVLAPTPRLQFLDNSGRPLSFGCVFTYQVATTTALTTYTDYTGVTQNADPVILSSGGTANIWLLAGQAYTFVVKSAGGVNCASGSTLYTVNGIGGGSTVLTTVVPYSPTPSFQDAAQIQMFTITLTGDASAQPLTFVGVTPPGIIYFQITEDGVGGHAFSWPANSIGGCTIGSTAGQVTTQEFVYNGSNATAVGPCVIGNGPSIDVGDVHSIGNVSANAFISNTVNPATAGVFRLAKTDAVNWRNNANSGNQGWSIDTSDRAIGSFLGGLELTGTTPDIFFGGTTNTFPRLKRNATGLDLRLADDSAYAPFNAGAVVANLSLAIAGSQALTGVQGSTGVKVFACTGAITTGHLIKTDASGNCIDAGQTSPTNANGAQLLIQSTRLTGSAVTFTYPTSYGSTPACVCTGEGGSCNVASVSTTACTLNITTAINDVIVTGAP